MFSFPHFISLFNCIVWLVCLILSLLYFNFPSFTSPKLQYHTTLHRVLSILVIHIMYFLSYYCCSSTIINNFGSVQLYGMTIVNNSTGTTIIWQEICDLDNQNRKYPRIVCYWNTGEVKEGKLKYNKERIRKTSQTIQLNREIKWGKLNIRKRN